MGVKNEVFTVVTDLTDFYVNNAVQAMMDKLPDDDSREIFQQELEQIGKQGIHSLISGQGFEEELKQGAVSAAKYAATHYAKEALENVAARMPEGYARSIVEEDLHELTVSGISSICDGADMDSVINDIETHFSVKTKNFLKSQSEKIGDSWIDSIASGFKDKGRGKGRTRRNREINNISGHIKRNLHANIAINMEELWQGNKDLPTALEDIVTNTAEEVVIDYVEEKAKQIGDDILKNVTKKASKEIVSRIEDKALKGIAKKGLKQLSSVDGFVEVGKCIGKFLDGELDRAELMQTVTDKAADYVTMVAEKLATALAVEAGPAAPIIGYLAGYVAGNFVRQAVAPFINAARKAKWAKERYEQVHALSKQSIKQMQEQRRLFEQETATLFSNRQKLIDESLEAIDDAIKAQDVNKASIALNRISQEFGKTNKLSTFEEFDAFVMSGEGEITW